MSKIPKGIIAIAVVLVATGVVFYRYSMRLIPAIRPEPMPSVDTPMMQPREVSAEVEYPVLDKYDHVRFTLVLDAEGVITDVREVDVATNKADEHQVEFAEGLSAVIKGKKLSELKAVDKIGKSTLTTDAFNSVINDLQAQL